MNTVARDDDGVSLLVHWEDYCTKQAEMYEMSRVFHSVCGNYITIPAIVIAGMSSVANIGLSASGLGCESTSTTSINWFTMGFSASGLLAAAILTITQYLKLSEMQVQCENVSGEFEKLALEIRMHLTLLSGLDSTYRNVAELVKDVKKKMDGLIDKAPSLPKHVERRFHKLVAQRTEV
jgi:hypothetical protein